MKVEGLTKRSFDILMQIHDLTGHSLETIAVMCLNEHLPKTLDSARKKESLEDTSIKGIMKKARKCDTLDTPHLASTL